MEKIKLVIWDLDETFWKGTLSEGGGVIEYIDSNIDLIKNLTDRGIMNTVVSKNDFETAKKALVEAGIFDYIIFPHISWKPKGEEIRHLLKQCSLRAVNCIFIDDNPSNLNEALYYNPGLNVVSPKFLKENDILSMLQFKGKDDHIHSRLTQYKNLEKRAEAEEQSSSNEDFLKESNIQISLGQDWENHRGRIVELIERTNQLNFTKKRISDEEFDSLINDDKIKKWYVSAKDNFGDYGIVGFIAVKNNKLEHFLFSCRILGLGVELYLFNKLGCPYIDIIGEVAVDLFDNKTIDWINETEGNQFEEPSDLTLAKEKILMIGGCDLEQTFFYLNTRYNIKTEFATARKGHEIRTSDMLNFINGAELSDEKKRELCENLPFFHSDITFRSRIFSGDYDVLILSVVDDFIRGVYTSNDGKVDITLGDFLVPKRWRTGFSKNELYWFDRNFTYCGMESAEYFENNLTYVLNRVSKIAKAIILINGNDIDVSDWENVGKELIDHYKSMNAVVDRVLEMYDNVFLLDMRKIVTNRAMFSKHDNRHYRRKVYFDMANTIKDILRENINIEISSNRAGIFKVMLKKMQRKLKIT